MAEKQAIYRRKPKTLKDKALGKGYIGAVASSLFIGSIFMTAVLAVSVAATATSGSAIAASTLTYAVAAICGSFAGALVVGRVANITDDANKERRFNKFKSKQRAILEEKMAGMSSDERIDFLKSERDKNIKAVKNIEQHFQDIAEQQRIEAELEKENLRRARNWVEHVNQHAQIEAKDELERVARAQ